MTVRGTARGRLIELDEDLPYPVGQPVEVHVEPRANGTPPPGSPASVLAIMRQPPHLTAEDGIQLLRAIGSGKLPQADRGCFDELAREDSL